MVIFVSAILAVLGMIFIDGEAVLTTTWTSGFGGGGPPLGNNVANINSAIAAVDAAAAFRQSIQLVVILR